MQIYTVRPGDTVNALAAEYGLDPGRIISDNGLMPDGLLVVGQSLIFLFPTETYTASGGETVSEIADRYQTTERELLRNNWFLQGKTTLSAGDNVVIRYEDAPTLNVFLGGYAYDFINQDLLESVHIRIFAVRRIGFARRRPVD